MEPLDEEGVNGEATNAAALTADTLKPSSKQPVLLHEMLYKVLILLKERGVQTEGEDGKLTGGVVLAQPYYAAALYAEGRAPEPAAAAGPPAALFAAITTAADDGTAATAAAAASSIELIPATADELAAGTAARLAAVESPIFARLLSPAALGHAFCWARVPAVCIFGGCELSDAALEAAEAAGLPVSPSMAGPHAEELSTQLAVFLRACAYPEHRSFVLTDRGFMVFGANLDEAAAAFDAAILPLLSKSGSAGMGCTAAAGGAGAGAAGKLGGLAGAISRLGSLLSRTTTESADREAAAAAAAGTGTQEPLGTGGDAATPLVDAFSALCSAFSSSQQQQQPQQQQSNGGGGGVSGAVQLITTGSGPLGARPSRQS